MAVEEYVAGDRIKFTAPKELELNSGVMSTVGIETLNFDFAKNSAGLATIRFDDEGRPTHGSDEPLRLAFDRGRELRGSAPGFQYVQELLADSEEWYARMNGAGSLPAQALKAPGLLGEIFPPKPPRWVAADQPSNTRQLPFGLSAGELVDEVSQATGRPMVASAINIVGISHVADTEDVQWVALRFPSIGVLGPVAIDRDHPQLMVIPGAIPYAGSFEVVVWSTEHPEVGAGEVVAEALLPPRWDSNSEELLMDLSRDARGGRLRAEALPASEIAEALSSWAQQ